MTFQQAIETCFHKYAAFGGRASRPEFWWFMLFLVLANLVLSLIDDALLPTDTTLLAPLFGLATILPTIAVSVRRLHDTGRTGWLTLLHLIPVVGLIVMIFFYVQPSAPGENEYGAAPAA